MPRIGKVTISIDTVTPDRSRICHCIGEQPIHAKARGHPLIASSVVWTMEH